MFDLRSLTKHDWVLVAVLVVLTTVAVGLGIYGLAN